MPVRQQKLVGAVAGETLVCMDYRLVTAVKSLSVWSTRLCAAHNHFAKWLDHRLSGQR